MASVLTSISFQLLLDRLDSDPAQAAGKYDLLRLKILKTLAWKGCADSEADALADTTLDRIAGKLAKGEQIQNLTAYSGAVLRFVWLEHSRRREDAAGDDLPEIAVEPNIDILNDSDTRLRFLRKCLAEKITNEQDKVLIIGYYDAEADEKNKDSRKNLAEKLGLTMTTLKVKACRLRERLEKCINECVEKLSVTKTPVSGTISVELK